MKHLFNFLYFLVMFIVSAPILVMLIVTAIVYWDIDYFDIGTTLLSSLWNKIVN